MNSIWGRTNFIFIYLFQTIIDNRNRLSLIPGVKPHLTQVRSYSGGQGGFTPQTSFMLENNQVCHFYGHNVLLFCIFGTEEEELGPAA